MDLGAAAEGISFAFNGLVILALMPLVAVFLATATFLAWELMNKHYELKFSVKYKQLRGAYASRSPQS